MDLDMRPNSHRCALAALELMRDHESLVELKVADETCDALALLRGLPGNTTLKSFSLFGAWAGDPDTDISEWRDVLGAKHEPSSMGLTQ